jgi:hypothetical protein
MSDTRTVHDPFLGKDVQVSDRLVDRLRGRYASGPHLPNGNPEFGWRQFQAPPIQHEAAAEIERLNFELKAVRNEIEIADGEIERLRGVAQAAPLDAAHEPSYIKNCLIQTRGEVLFSSSDNSVRVTLDGYAIIPREDYEALTSVSSTPSEPAQARQEPVTDAELALAIYESDPENTGFAPNLEHPCYIADYIFPARAVLRQFDVARKPASPGRGPMSEHRRWTQECNTHDRFHPLPPQTDCRASPLRAR